MSSFKKVFIISSAAILVLAPLLYAFYKLVKKVDATPLTVSSYRKRTRIEPV